MNNRLRTFLNWERKKMKTLYEFQKLLMSEREGRERDE